MLKKTIYLVFILMISIGTGRIWQVPEEVGQLRPHIQNAINDDRVCNFDTLSVRQGTVEDPEIYYENINFRRKNITLINRDFLEGNSEPLTCIIDGQGSGTVVTIDSNQTNDAILQGFTIQNGLATQWGGGLYIDSASPTITDNIIRNNQSDWGGGGIACGSYRRTITRPIIKNNVISGNRAAYKGGGINIEQTDTVKILDNTIVHNTCEDGHGGGGIRISWCGPGAVISGNIIDTNYSGGPAAGGGGILFEACNNVLVRNNTIRKNTARYARGWGIFCQDDFLPDLGTSQDPGFNVIMDNEAKDLYHNVLGLMLKAEGNYWGTLDIDTLRVHTGQKAGGGPVDFDPIAASDRVASVNHNSYCETGVIVTGDLTVNSGVNLTIAPGKRFQFLTSGDDANTGFYQNLSELLINGTLIANGNENEPIGFVPYPPAPPTGGWYGIRLLPNSTGNFDYSLVGGAYCGIEAEGLSNITVDHSTIEHCQIFGIRLNGVQSAEIANSEINHNIYGIRCENIPNWISPVIKGNTIIENERYGIMAVHCEGAVIRHNHIIGASPDWSSTLHGILLGWGGHGTGLYVKHNKVEWCNQSGIYDYGSNVHFYNDTLLNNRVYGFLFSGGSTSSVRCCYVNLTKVDVHCDGNSYPTLGVDDPVVPNPGLNQFLMESNLWLENLNPGIALPIMAEWNWWGTDRPNLYPERFVGPVDYDPWLREPPPPPPDDSTEGGEGGQSANITKPNFTFALYPPKPNPAKREIKIVYSLPERCQAEFIICDASGRIITRRTEEKDAGHYEFLWQGKDEKGKMVPNGIYFVRLKAGNNLQTQKLTLAR